MRLQAGAGTINLTQAKSLFQASALSEKIVYLPVATEVNKDATDEARKDEKKKRTVVLKGYASTPKLDSHRHTITPKSWRKPRALARYQKNPIILFQHSPDYPVGTAADFNPDEGGLWMERIEISGAARIPTGEELGDALEDGRLRTLSVGIKVLDYEVTELDGEVFATITDLELMEVSIVSLPANDDAIFEVVKGIEDCLTKSLVPTSKQNGGSDMDRKLICKSLGIADDSTDEQIMAAQNRVLLAVKSAQELRKRLGLDANASEEDVEKKMKSVEAIAAENKKLRAKELLAKYDPVISEGLLPWATEKAENDPDDFERWAKAATPLPYKSGPVLGTSQKGAQQTPAKKSKSATVTEEDEYFCEKFGVFENADEMEKMANMTPAEALGLIFPGHKFALTNADRETMKKRAAVEQTA